MDNNLGESVVQLTKFPTTKLHTQQISKYSLDSIHAQKLTDFDAGKASSRLQAEEGQRVIAADFGGDKGICRVFVVQHGMLTLTDEYVDDVQGDDGKGYVDSIEKAARYAEANNLPMGISWGGPLEGTKLQFHPKAKVFCDELNDRYDGDLAKISPNIKACLNDGPAGLISGAVEAYRKFNANNVIFIINGGGIGVAFLKDDTIYASEAGHVEAIAELNDYHQDTSCGVFGANYTCLERLGANKAGIEAQWQSITGKYLRAKDIEQRYKEGNKLAGELYAHSALIISHVIAGSAKAMGIDISDSKTAIVCHGGAFKFPYYGDRITQIIESTNGKPPQLLMTKDYCDVKSNACLDGAAIAALTLA